VAPVFDGARAKVDHAFEHLQSLDADLARAVGGQAYAIGGHYKPESAEIDLYALGTEFPRLQWGVRIGDCLHNLRSALDHITWQLALDHLGREPTDDEARQIQFPLEVKSASFQSAKVRRHVSAAHIPMLDQFQPYHAGNDAPRHRLAILHRLSNIDKHRVVHAAAVVPAEFHLQFVEGSGIESYDSIELFSGQTMHEETQIGVLRGVVATRSDAKVAGYGPFSAGVVLDAPGDPILHHEAVTNVLGTVGEAVDVVVKWFEAEFAPAP
jgi:hypothetical protein